MMNVDRHYPHCAVSIEERLLSSKNFISKAFFYQWYKTCILWSSQTVFFRIQGDLRKKIGLGNLWPPYNRVLYFWTNNALSILYCHAVLIKSFVINKNKILCSIIVSLLRQTIVYLRRIKYQLTESYRIVLFILAFKTYTEIVCLITFI